MAPQEETARTTSEPQPVEPDKMTRKDRLAEHNEKRERIVHYLRHGKHQAGLSKNQQRKIVAKLRTMFWMRQVNTKYMIYYSVI